MRIATSPHRLNLSSDDFAIACYLALGGFLTVVVTMAMYLYMRTQ
jgi:hypothetical protein